MTGPTGVGKTSLAVALAGKLNGEIIGADAFQIYAGLPLLTAQPSADLQEAVPHHLIGFLDLRESFSAARYVSAARACLAEVAARGRRPILVGGTGMYLKALTHGLADLPPVDPALRAELAELSLEEAQARLAALDPEAPGQIDIRNPVRVRRALEIVTSTGRTLAAVRRQWSAAGEEFDGILLVRDREDLRERIANHVDAMLGGGAIEEVRCTREVAGAGPRRAIGFSDIEDFLDGRRDLLEVREAIVRATRGYAKRQLTWCRNQFTFPTISLTVTTDPLDAALRQLAGQPA